MPNLHISAHCARACLSWENFPSVNSNSCHILFYYKQISKNLSNGRSSSRKKSFNFNKCFIFFYLISSRFCRVILESLFGGLGARSSIDLCLAAGLRGCSSKDLTFFSNLLSLLWSTRGVPSHLKKYRKISALKDRHFGRFFGGPKQSIFSLFWDTVVLIFLQNDSKLFVLCW